MKERKRVLVVDDDAGHRSMLKTLLSGWGYEIVLADDGMVGVEKVQEGGFDIVLMDMRMVKMSGMEALEAIHQYNPSLPVVIMTAYSSVETAVDALKKGACDYLTKPLDFEKLKLTMARILESIYLKQENETLKQRLGKGFNRERIIGRSSAMTALLDTVEMVAASDANILITGASGTGKELIAGAVHYNSPRKAAPFVRINCAAITETLLESELFGHERGAFTGAERQRKGRFREAHGGSILLDEIGEMPLAMQAKLLRVLQEKEVTPVGGDKNIKVDVRVIASTNRSLGEMVAGGTFREDLFFRLNVVRLSIPVLADRREDVPELAQYFLKSFAEKNHREIKGFAPEAMDAMIRYSWPGNVRELMNCVERCVVLARSQYITHGDLPFVSAGQEKEEYPGPLNHLSVGDIPLVEVEQKAVLQTLSSAGGNRSEAARRLGITRKTLLKKLKQYGKA
ncbi:two-component system, NtrC family, response regulator HydG [Desulfocicer vacuolatum DSM 3385]|uniref:Two-component system, NtrC family, response regulator HydG n=1 Tax=Desulfocicer vacuolatum DSM 3385 TaxID=1121400 RepID=A0A1W1ZSP4_9BACT|nr:sigma-54 dependent transcriptional regulator [Desulfocicer vacuolatum]SMC51081.1 two-component system, NtrC family, response regulator HydG [Desulfocicer vacuolatum DSM 3385]